MEVLLSKAKAQMWAVKDPHGYLYAPKRWAKFARAEFLKDFVNAPNPDLTTWKHWYRQGYRCVRVDVTEV